MTIEHYDNDSNGHFRAVENGQRIATMTYIWSDDRLIINHTEVDPHYKGRGIGQSLVEAAVHFARDRRVKIDPWCPFARAIINKAVAWNDVV